MQPNPRWISSDEIEATCCRDFREVNREGERQCGPGLKFFFSLAQLAQRDADIDERSPCVGGGGLTTAEQVARAGGGHQLTACVFQRSAFVSGCVDRHRALGAVQHPCKRFLAGTLAPRVPAAQPGDRGPGCMAGRNETAARERITHADLAIEIAGESFFLFVLQPFMGWDLAPGQV